MGESNLKVHDFENNLEFSKLNEIKLLRARIRKFYELCFLGLIDIEQPSYETYGGKQREKQGIDTQISFEDRDVTVQEKIRTPKYWDSRQKDIYVELENDYRGGDGWFYKYKDKIDYLGYFWTKEGLEELHFVLYNNDFFKTVEGLIKSELVFYPKCHYQKSNGNIGGKTSGCIVNQFDLKSCEVARFHFRNNQYKKI